MLPASPGPWSHAWVNCSCSDELSPSHAALHEGSQCCISQPMLKLKQEPPQQQLGGIEHRKYLLGWATAISFSPPAKRRGGVRDGASCNPQRDRAVMGATAPTLEGQPGFAQVWLYRKKTDVPLPQHEDAWRHQEVTRRSWCCPTVSKGDPPFLPSAGARGTERAKTLLQAAQEPGAGKGSGDICFPQVRALTFVPGGPGRRR